VVSVRRFRKRPVVIEAVQWTGDNLAELDAFTGLRFRAPFQDLAQVFDVLHDTWVKVAVGQWVIKGVKGEFYPCDDEVLQATYEEVTGS